jgi:hypothetical protein
MNLHTIEGPSPPDLGWALEAFEAEFIYPLGAEQSFSIAHGPDYARFFRAMGDAACFVAEDRGRVIATMAGAIRRLGLPDGREQRVAYFGDLKMTSTARHSRVLHRILREAQRWAEGLVEAAFSVVMDGTRATPERYTGRLGLPVFSAVGQVLVLRLAAIDDGQNDTYGSDPVAGERLYRGLSLGRYHTLGGMPAERSDMTPMWLIAGDGAACGRLEDTRRAKRLLGSTGAELISAHLSCFAFKTPEAGIGLLSEASRRAARLGYPALFVAMAEQDFEALRGACSRAGTTVAPATIFAAHLESGPRWNINTAEI